MTYRDPVATACSLIANLYEAHMLADRERLFLHAAGVKIGGGLVLLTGHYRAGKSVVATACAAAGLQVFSDDIIPLDPGGSPLAARAMIQHGNGILAHQRDGQVFLTDTDGLAIFNLNANGAAVWRVLEQPTAFGDLAQIFFAAFPGRDPEEIAIDLSRLTRDLAASGLVRIEPG